MQLDKGPNYKTRVRHDIQFMRGLAVLAVVLFHSGILQLSGGFLGVDIFFVISGFLITSIILRDIDNGNFSFKAFYIRRAKRLIPAAYCTLLFSTLISYGFLTNAQWNDYIQQFVGTITYTANLILPFQTGYFEETSASKPLLHIWSLSLEEQYYLCIPIFLFLVVKKWRTLFLSVGIISSILLCLFLVSQQLSYWRLPTIDSRDMAFYLLPTRAWELLTGSLSAWMMLQSPKLTIQRHIKIIALVVICIVIFYPLDYIHPRGDALLVVLATAVLLMGQDNWLPVNHLTHFISKIGDWSYSLYLIHWPIFAFAHIGYLGMPPKSVLLGLCLAAVILAYLQYQYVEQPFRYGWKENHKKTLGSLMLGSLIILILPVPAMIQGHKQNSHDIVDFKSVRKPNKGLHGNCSEFTGSGTPIPPCMTSDTPSVAVWGDSFAMHLVPGLATDPEVGRSLVQITKIACAPIKGIASTDTYFNELWAPTCINFNKKALQYIQNNVFIKHVILGSPFSGYFNYGQLDLFHDDRLTGEGRTIAISQMIETIEDLHRYNKHPVIFAPPPMTGFNIGECLERKSLGLLVLNQHGCDIKVSDYQSFQRGIIDALSEIKRKTNVDIVWLDKAMCNGKICQTKINDTYLYRDNGHLTIEGSRLLISRLKLPDILPLVSRGFQ